MDSQKLKAIIIAILGIFFALYLGIGTATAQFETIIKIIGSLTIIVCFLLGRKIWLLIPLMATIELSLRIPGQPSTLLIAQGLVIAFLALLLLMRRLPYRFNFTELEVWGLILTAFVAQVYLRNPVGLNILGGESVGGKPYILFGITLVTAALLAGLRVPPGELKTALKLSILGGLINFGVSTIGRFVPTVGYYLGSSYVDTSAIDYSDHGKQVDTGATSREGFLGTFAKNLSLWVSSFKSALMACFHPLFATLILISFAAAGLSGFRNIIAAVGLTYFIGLCYRGGLAQVLTSCVVGALALGALAVTNAVAPLPPNIQRSLAFLPGTWEQRYKTEGEQSTDWRVEIWEEVLLTDRWIENKIIGDGLGFSARELQYQLAANNSAGTARSMSGFDAHRETILASGDYHSGPVQTVRVIGYAGLVVLLLFQIRLAIHAHRQIKRCRGTEWFPISLFIGIPLIWNPIFFIFIYGTFSSATTTLFIGSAMVRMLQNNLTATAPARNTIYTNN
jgi:hypothetical protein